MKRYLPYLTDKEILERITTVETETRIRHEEAQRALVLAREVERLRLELSNVELKHRLEVLNDHKKSMDELKGILASKDFVLDKVDIVKEKVESAQNRQEPKNKLIYIGLGVFLAIQFIALLLYKLAIP